MNWELILPICFFVSLTVIAYFMESTNDEE